MKNIFFYIILSLFTSVCFASKNQAMDNCFKNGGKYTVLKSKGICWFSDNTYCEERSFLKGKCMKGKNKVPAGQVLGKNNKNLCLSKDTNNPLITICKQ